MARYIGPKLKIIRRIGKLRGLTRKKPFRRTFKGKGPLSGKVIPPGQHGLVKLLKTRPYDSCESDYLIRLKVKQRLRFNYGLTERQLVNYVRKAKKIKEATGVVLLQFLEMRLDNIVYRLNMAPTIVAARQLISHCHIRVNTKKVNIASYMCKPKDVISVAMKEKSLRLVNKNLSEYYKRMRFYKKRLEKTLSFILFKLKIVSNMGTTLQLINQGLLKINNKRVRTPNTVCSSRDILTILTKQGIRTIKLAEYFGEVPRTRFAASSPKVL
ncbi:MAG: 30S ribosomal protein S4 [Agrobacterium sp.]|uniref:Small ribosomal subunit protein uS4c n=1 Tax=Haematococcus lacustris TaxID=44745 RepID=A0A0S2IDM2_HAELA|nr:30S ribosomal protein S4 [Haematococcus lacustris]ALO21589.1 ribosomal protein S4 [Haematococcus lacustris]AUW36486.1 30S ribosomal protein S4 [Haematococcus lacustris]